MLAVENPGFTLYVGDLHDRKIARLHDHIWRDIEER